ncbi:MAG: SDR family oxidoreductase [Geminicoccaceae bacterium]
MDLGIGGKRAIVCAASKGLGRACAMALAENGVDLVINARGSEALEATAAAIRSAHGVTVTVVAGDVATEAGRAALLAACSEPDILVNNAGGPPPGDFRDWGEEAWLAALRANMLAPIALIRATVDGMGARGFGRIVNITSAAVKAPIAELGLSNGARAGLTGFVAGAARQVAGTGVTINNLLPGRFATDRLRANIAGNAKRRGVSEAEAERAAITAVPAGRFGDPAEFGQYCAFLCSQQAGYITGQNLLIDGGSFPGTL